jgi:peptidoglycan/LPS O-acetylase OafA/YrhL
LSPAYAYLCDVPYLGLGPAARGLLRYSQYFLGDYVLGGLIAMNIAALPSCGFRFGRMSGSIRYVAALSFALYLFHYPLLELFSPWLAPLPLAVAVLAAVWVLGIATEALRAVLRSQASAAVARAQRRREAPSLPRPQRV